MIGSRAVQDESPEMGVLSELEPRASGKAKVKVNRPTEFGELIRSSIDEFKMNTKKFVKLKKSEKTCIKSKKKRISRVGNRNRNRVERQ